MAVAVAWSLGCSGGGARKKVECTIKYKDKDVAGTLELHQDGKKTWEGPITKGKVTIPNQPKGTYKVAIKSMMDVSGVGAGGPGTTNLQPPPSGSKDGTSVMPDMGGTIDPPKKYSNPETSGLTLEITGDKQTVEFPLTD